MNTKLKLNTKDESLREILSNGKTYFVPKFQRDYSWEYEHWEIFREDIDSIMEQDNEYHYMGYLVLQQNDNNQFKIIDGQQRLTTFSLLVLAAIKVLKNADNEQDRIEELHKNFIGSKNLITLKTVNKIQLNRNNDYYFRQAVNGESIPNRNTKKTVLLMSKALKYFYDVLEDKSGKDIGRIIERISQNLLFTTIYISDELNAYKVFETLNARGARLSSADLLKNYLFSIIDEQNDKPDDVLNNLEETWVKIGDEIGENHYTDYIICDWNSNHSLIRKTALFRAIRKEINNINKADDYLQRLASNSQLYAALLNAEDDFWKDHSEYTSIKWNLFFLKLFNIKQPLVLLYSAYLHFQEDFDEILKWVVNLSFRYNVISHRHPGDQEIVYNKIAREISDNNITLLEIKKKLLELYPSDEQFAQNFTDTTMPTGRSNKKVKYILARLMESKNNPVDETRLTVEHILPQNPSQEWITYFGDNWRLCNQRIGNMTLISQRENQKLDQESFQKKKEILSRSKYSLNHNIARYEQWDAQSVESRQKVMAEQAIRIWMIE